MVVQNGLDDIQPQPHALPVLAAGVIGLVEAVKDQRQLLRRDGLTHIAHRDVGLSPFGRHADAQGLSLGGELDGVIQQIVAHLRDSVRIPPHLDGLLGELGIHVQMAGIDLALQAHQHPQHDLADVKLLLGGHVLGRLKAAQVQHPAHQAGQPPGLGGDGLESGLLLFRRDGAVQDAVGKAGDGSHGGLELMGDIGHEFAAPGLGLGQGVRHGVEGGGQLPHLVAAFAGAAHPHVELPVAKLAGGLGHLLQGLGLPQRGDRAGDKGDEQHHDGGEEKDTGEGPPHLSQAGSLGGHKDHAEQLILHHQTLASLKINGLHQDGGPGHEPLFRKDAPQVGHAGVAPGGGHLADHIGGHRAAGQVGPVAAVGGIKDQAVGLGDNDIRVGDLGQSVDVDGVIVLLPQSGGGGAQGAHKGLGDVLGVVPQAVPLLLDGVLVG